MTKPAIQLPGGPAISRGTLGLVLVGLLIGQSATPIAAADVVSGPVYRGTLAWTIPALTAVAPAGNGFLGVGLARIGPGYAVVGLLAPPSQEDPARPSVWLSPDGSRWRSPISLPLPTDGTLDWIQLTGAAGGSARIVAVGYRSENGRHPAAEVWTGTYLAP